MSLEDTKTHYLRNESSSPNASRSSYTSTNSASPLTQSGQLQYANTFSPPHRRPRGNTFGMPGPDMGKMPAFFASTDRSRLGVIPDPNSGAEQQQDDEGEPDPLDDRDDEDSEGAMEGSHNEEHTFGIKMPQFSLNRRPRVDSYASITSNWSNSRGQDGGSAQGVNSHHYLGTADGSIMQINTDQSSLYTTNGAVSPIDRSLYEEDNPDRSSMLTASPTLNFTNDWSTGEPRGSIATLTFGRFGESSTSAPSYATQRISVVDGGTGIAGSSENEDGRVAGIGTTAAETPTTTNTFTSIPAFVSGKGGDRGAGLLSGVSPSSTASLLQSSSHGHTYKNLAPGRNSPLLSSHQRHSPRPSIDSLRSNRSLFRTSKLTDKSKSEEEHSNHSGASSIGPGTRMGTDANARVTITMGIGGSSPVSASMTARTNDTNIYSGVHSAAAISSLPSSPSPLGRQSQARPPRPSRPADITSTHVIHRSDSLEKLHTKRRSTVSSTGSTSTSFFGGITSIFHISNNSNNMSSNMTRTSGITPSELVRRPKSSTAVGSGGSGGASRLAIGVSQQERWERERDRQRDVVKGREGDTEYFHDNQPSKDTLLHRHPYPQRPKAISIPSDSPSVVSPSGSIFIETFTSPVEDNDGAFDLKRQKDQGNLGSEAASNSNLVLDSTDVRHDHAPFPVAASGPSTFSAPSASAVDRLEPLGHSRLNPSVLTRSKDRREHYTLGPGQEIHQELSRRPESDGKGAGDGADDADGEKKRDYTALQTTTESSSLSPASSPSTHFLRSHGRSLRNGFNDMEDENIIRRQSHGHGNHLHDPVQSSSLSNANVDLSSGPTTTAYSGPTFSSPNDATLNRGPSADAPNDPSNFLNFTFPSPFLSLTTTATPTSTIAASPATQVPAETTPTSPTRRLLHSFSQPSLRLSAQTQAASPPSRSEFAKAYRLPAQPSLTSSSTAANQGRVQTDPHPYAMYASRSKYYPTETTSSASAATNSHQIPAALSASITHANKPSIHPYSNVYEQSIQTQGNSDFLYHPTMLQGRHESHMMATTSAITPPSSNDETARFHATSSPHGLKRTLRSPFKLPRSSTPNSAAVDANPKALNATTPARTTAGGNSRSSIRSSASMPNLRSLFKVGHSHDKNKSNDRDDIPSANAKGKQPASAVATLQPTTPKKVKRSKTQYAAETWCDALLFPRPRFRAHVTSPPPSPIHVSALSSANSQNGAYPQPQSSPGSLDWEAPATQTTSVNLAPDTMHRQPRTPPRETRFVADSPYSPRVIPPPPKLKAPPKGKLRKGITGTNSVSIPWSPEADAIEVEPQPMLSKLEQVLIEGEIRHREREQWSEIATSSFQNRRSRSLSRSRKRAGTTTSTLTSSSAAPSSEHGRGRGRTRNHSDAGRRSDERTHGTTSSISRSLAVGLTTIAAEAFRQPTPTISTVSHYGGHGTGDNHHQTATMTTDTHSNGYHSRTTSESGPAGQRHGQGSSHTRNTSWGKAALKTLCGSASEDEGTSRPSEEEGAGTVVRGRSTTTRINGKQPDTDQQPHPKIVNPNTNHPRDTPHSYVPKVNFSLSNGSAATVTLPPVSIPSTAVAERSLSPNSSTSEPAEIVIAVSTPPQSAAPNDSIFDLSTHPYAQFPASAPYAGPYPSSRDYKPLYTPRQNNFSHRLQSSFTPGAHEITTFGSTSQVPSTFTAAVRPYDMDVQPSSRKKTDPTPYAYANVGESNKRESKLGVEEALMSSSFRGFACAILEDESNILPEVATPKHSPRSLTDTEEEEQAYHYAVLNEISALPNVTSSSASQVHGKAQYVQSPPHEPNTTTLSSPSSQNSSYSWMSRPLGAVDDLDQFRDLFFRRPVNSPGTTNNATVFDSNSGSGFYQRSPITSSSQFLGSPSLLPPSPAQHVSNDREQRTLKGPSYLHSPSLTNASPQFAPSDSAEIDNVVPQDLPEDIVSSRASSVIEHDSFVEDTLRLGIVPLSVPITTESVEQRHSTTLSFVDSNNDTRNRDTIMSTASAYSAPSVNNDSGLRQSFVTNDSSTSGVAKLLGNFPSPPPPSRIGNSRPDSYHVLGLAESRHIMTTASSSPRT